MVSLSAPNSSLSAHVELPASKSESNRALIIKALSKNEISLNNLASARDTRTMIRLLESEGHVLDVIDAGTTMRFLTAYCAAIGRDQILTGTPRMCKRPIGILVDALRELGAEIEYWKQEGYPPLHIISKGSAMVGGEIAIQGNISSQFISALLMIGPVLEGGLTLNLIEPIYSRPYIEMTLGLMRQFGIESRWDGNSIIITQGTYQGGEYTIESDWSAASYWYSFVAIAPEAEVFLKGLRQDSRQGDHKIAELMRHFGVASEFTDEGVKLSKIPVNPDHEIGEVNFVDFPDLAQTIAVVSAYTGINIKMSGLESLRIKETDRIDALTKELAKFQVKMFEETEGVFTFEGTFTPSEHSIDTYEDHRMAMAFAPLVFAQPTLDIKDPSVVEKSYPEFWQHLEKVGIKVNEW